MHVHGLLWALAEEVLRHIVGRFALLVRWSDARRSDYLA